jgi:hypothetical protein
METMPSRQVAEVLSAVWAWHRTPEFLDYVAESFGVQVSDPAQFDRLYLYQVAEGTIEDGIFDHGSTFQWWEVDDAGMRECNRPDCKLGWVDAPEKVRGSFYRWPHISFLHCGSMVGFGETYGTHLVNRKVGHLVTSDGGMEIVDVRVVWPASAALSWNRRSRGMKRSTWTTAVKHVIGVLSLIGRGGR